MPDDDIRFQDTWKLWYHVDPHRWSIKSFKCLCSVSTVSEFWSMVDGIATNPSLLFEHIYVMREGVEPLWEHPRNRNGGCWSLKVDLKDSFTVLAKTLALIMGENSLYTPGPEATNLSMHVTGVSFSSKNSFNVITQIWNDDNTINKVSYLHPEISSKYMADILYRSHIPEY